MYIALRARFHLNRSREIARCRTSIAFCKGSRAFNSDSKIASPHLRLRIGETCQVENQIADERYRMAKDYWTAWENGFEDGAA
jgi:hypothetical protein